MYVSELALCKLSKVVFSGKCLKGELINAKKDVLPHTVNLSEQLTCALGDL